MGQTRVLYAVEAGGEDDGTALFRHARVAKTTNDSGIDWIECYFVISDTL